MICATEDFIMRNSWIFLLFFDENYEIIVDLVNFSTKNCNFWGRFKKFRGKKYFLREDCSG
jgi:hypothetical protein